MDAEAVVALLRPPRLAGVERHPHPHHGVHRPGMVGDRALRVDRGGDAVPGCRERDEAPVAGGVHLGAAVPGNHVTQQPAVVAQDVAVAIAELPNQAGRSLEIREEQRDGAGGQCGQAGLP